MNAADLVALGPMIAIAATAVVAMLATPFFRSQRVVAAITFVGLGAALMLIGPARNSGVEQVGPLIIVDGYALFYTGLVVAAAMVVVLLSYGYLRNRPVMRCEFYVLLAVATLGAVVLASSNHFASFFLGLEILSVSLYALIGYQRTNPLGIEAALKYLVLGGTSSAMLLFGMALVYAETGQLRIEDRGLRIEKMEQETAASGLRLAVNPQSAILNPQLNEPQSVNPQLAIIGLGLILVGVGFKLSLAPMHLWAADVYQARLPPSRPLSPPFPKGRSWRCC